MEPGEEPEGGVLTATRMNPEFQQSTFITIVDNTLAAYSSVAGVMDSKNLAAAIREVKRKKAVQHAGTMRAVHKLGQLLDRSKKRTPTAEASGEPAESPAPAEEVAPTPLRGRALTAEALDLMQRIDVCETLVDAEEETRCLFSLFDADGNNALEGEEYTYFVRVLAKYMMRQLDQSLGHTDAVYDLEMVTQFIVSKVDRNSDGVIHMSEAKLGIKAVVDDVDF